MTTLLLILDGWGYNLEQKGNAIALAKTPNFDYLWNNYPHALLSASGLDVGLPEGQMGNSEVGHLHIGSGCTVMQELTNLELAIEQGTFFKNSVLQRNLDIAKHNDKKVHIMGLLSTGGVHSHLQHIEAMVEMAVKNGNKKIFLHAFLDGRDTPPKSAENFIQILQEKLSSLGSGSIATLCGRFYAMDRDKRWDRIEKAYNLLVKKRADFVYSSALEGIQAAYQRGETDEFVQPTLLDSEGCVEDGDVVFFMNFRADRAREISYAFTKEQFLEFERHRVNLGGYVTLTQYAKDLVTEVAYPPKQLKNILGEVVANAGLKQLRIAETEKYAHVTYFVNGGREEAFVGEERVLVPSPKVATYDLQPEMSLYEVTDKLLQAIESRKFDLIVANFANTDMVGHTGKLEAAICAVEKVDEAIGKILEALRQTNGEMVLIADHGNAEKMINLDTNVPHTAHTTNLVPFIYFGRSAETLVAEGKLIDVAPTILYLMNLNIPKEMSGRILVKLDG